MPCIAHSVHPSPFDSGLAKCRRVVGHFKHSPANQAELEQQQVTHQKKESLAQEVSTRWNSTLEGRKEKTHITWLRVATALDPRA
ncbi:unnamed protein product [Pleuronectes platessa]|uniref:Uncharacterized protein n=1 Tax=Pleuronectes platessa TaxID=8262 RepID=A0A9N7YH52_PLEPL|nr:unnamed protein product [Pleuronectes platessa]